MNARREEPVGRVVASIVGMVLTLSACGTPQPSSDEVAQQLWMLMQDGEETYLIRPDGSERRSLELKPKAGSWLPSPQGTRLAHWNNDAIWTADVTDFVLNRIVMRADKDERIDDLAWTADGEWIVYVSDRALSDAADNSESTMWKVRFDGSERSAVRSWTMATFVVPVAIDAQGQVYWFENAPSNQRLGLFTTDLATGETREIMPDPGAIPAFNFQLSSDFRELYFSTQNSGPLVEHDLTTGARRTLDKEGGYYLLISPNGDALYYAQIPTRGPGAKTFRMSLPDGISSVMFEDDAEGVVIPTSISPDGRYLEFQTEDQMFIFDRTTEEVAGEFPSGNLRAWVTVPSASS